MQHCTSLRYIIKVEEAYQMTFSALHIGCVGPGACQGVLMAENEDVYCRLPVIQHVTSHLQLFHLLHEHYNLIYVDMSALSWIGFIFLCALNKYV